MDKQFVNLNNLDIVWDEHSKDIEEVFDHFEAVAQAEAVENGDDPEAAVDFTTDRDESGNIRKKLLFKFGIPKGDKGDKGEKGDPGPQGDKGEKGDPNFISRSVTAFCSTADIGDETFMPKTPVGGSWDPDTDIVNPPTDPEGKVTWVVGNTDIDGDDFTPPVWSSYGWINYTAGKDPVWERPILVSGSDGKPGQDGASIEFVYARTKKFHNSQEWKDADVWPDNNKFTPDHIPSDIVYDGETITWYDHPLGVDEFNSIEWVCSRKIKDPATGEWGEWNADENGEQGPPTIWSWWGRDGKDGDGVQYIFMRCTGTPSVDPNPTDPEGTNANYWAFDVDYQNKYEEYIPKVTDEHGHIFTDNDADPTADEPNVWCWRRKYKFFKNEDLIKLGFKDSDINTDYEGTYLWDKYTGPTLWAHYGRDGYDSIFLEYRYDKIVGTNPNDLSPFVWDNIEPGGEWSATIPKAEVYEAVYEIQAWCIRTETGVRLATVDDGIPIGEDGNPVYGWQGPTLKSGIKGDVPKYKIDVFKLSEDKPDKPTFTDIPLNYPVDGWEDYPNKDAEGLQRWWRCVGTVNGVYETIESWGEPIASNGVDGAAQPGVYTEFRYAKGKYSLSSDNVWGNENGYDWINASVTRECTNGDISFSKTIPSLSNTPENPEYLYMTQAVINSNDTLKTNWEYPVRVSGEQGPKGEDGKNGDFWIFYSLGTISDYTASEPQANWSREDMIANNWDDDVPSTTDALPYIWVTQSRIEYKLDDSDGKYYPTYNWCRPFKASGLQGKPGNNYDFIYCRGTINSFAADAPTQTTDTPPVGNGVNDWKADPSAVKTDDTYQYIWACQGLQESTNVNGGWVTSWTWGNPYRFTGLNGKDGVDGVDGVDGEPGSTGKMVYPAGVWDPSTTYESDNKKAPYVEHSGSYYILTARKATGKVPSEAPAYWELMDSFSAVYAEVLFSKFGRLGQAVFANDYMLSAKGYEGSSYTQNYTRFEPDNGFDNSPFKPSVCIDLKNGTMWLGAGKTVFNHDGSAKLAGGNVEIDSSGNVAIKGAIKTDWQTGGKDIDIKDGIPMANLIQITSAGEYTLPTDDAWIGMELTVLNESGGDVTIPNVVKPAGYGAYSIPPEQVSRFVCGSGGKWYMYREAVMNEEEEVYTGNYTIHMGYIVFNKGMSHTYEAYATRTSNKGNTESVTAGTWTFSVDNSSWFTVKSTGNKCTVTFDAPSSVPTYDRITSGHINVTHTYNGITSWGGANMILNWN